MKKIGKRLQILCVGSIICSCLVAAALFYSCRKGGKSSSDHLGLIVFSDIHYLAPGLMTKGKTFNRYQVASGRLAELSAPLWSVASSQILSYKENIVLICGDLSNNGERQSHVEFAQSLRELERSGKWVFVVPGNNDIQNSRAEAYRGDTLFPVSTVNKNDFAFIYSEFGYGEAISRDSSSLSYVARINRDNWLMALDLTYYDPATSQTKGAVKQETVDWIAQQLDKAKKQKIRVIGMSHYGVVEHFDKQKSMFPTSLVEDHRSLANFLADKGVHILFTGHFHAMDITRFSSLNRNEFFEIETGAMIASPFGFRRIELEETKMHVFTESLADEKRINSVGYDPDSLYRKLMTSTCVSLLRRPPYSFNELLSELTAPVVAEAMIAHYKGDEKPNPSVEAIIRMLKSLNVKTDMEYLHSLYLDLPPKDNRVILELPAD
ncbi:MAG: metallophosphoesterase [Bacteroidales bacterium]|jgi:predicted MPP superfamily phosphohydrolase|nr:metallophosphoesterase [Bacteroidales bacterium]